MRDGGGSCIPERWRFCRPSSPRVVTANPRPPKQCRGRRVGRQIASGRLVLFGAFNFVSSHALDRDTRLRRGVRSVLAPARRVVYLREASFSRIRFTCGGGQVRFRLFHHTHRTRCRAASFKVCHQTSTCTSSTCASLCWGSNLTGVTSSCTCPLQPSTSPFRRGDRDQRMTKDQFPHDCNLYQQLTSRVRSQESIRTLP